MVSERVIKIEELILIPGDTQGHWYHESYNKTEYEEAPQVP